MLLWEILEFAKQPYMNLTNSEVVQQVNALTIVFRDQCGNTASYSEISHGEFSVFCMYVSEVAWRRLHTVQFFMQF